MVLVTSRTRAVATTLEDTITTQLAQPAVERRRRDAEVALKVNEATHSQKDVAQDQQVPPRADLVDGTRQRARMVGKRRRFQASTTIVSSLALCN